MTLQSIIHDRARKLTSTRTIDVKIMVDQDNNLLGGAPGSANYEGWQIVAAALREAEVEAKPTKWQRVGVLLIGFITGTVVITVTRLVSHYL